MNTTEELEKYYERDMIEYLDNAAQARQIGDYSTEQYVEDTKESLKTKDTVSAIKTTIKARLKLGPDKSGQIG